VDEEKVKQKSRQAGQAASFGLTVMTLGVGVNDMNSLCTPSAARQCRQEFVATKRQALQEARKAFRQPS
jgi:hypothetical protein